MILKDFLFPIDCVFEKMMGRHVVPVSFEFDKGNLMRQGSARGRKHQRTLPLERWKNDRHLAVERKNLASRSRARVSYCDPGVDRHEIFRQHTQKETLDWFEIIR